MNNFSVLACHMTYLRHTTKILVFNWKPFQVRVLCFIWQPYPFSLVLMTFYKGHVAFLDTCRWQSDQIISWALFGKSKFNTVLFILYCLIRLFKILFNIISYINEVFTKERYILKWLKTKYNSVLIFPQPTIQQIPTHMQSNSSKLQCLLYF